MKLSQVPHEIAEVGLRILKTICMSTSTNELSPLQISFITGVQKHILNTNFNIDKISLITSEELADFNIPDEFKNRIIRGGIIAACIDGEMSNPALNVLEKFVSVMKIDPTPILTARKLADKNLILARYDIVRKSLPGVMINQIVKTSGITSILKQFLPMFGIENNELASKYRSLENYPLGSLGRAYIDYLQRNSFPLPGQKGSGPEIIVVHDCLHILGDYGTTPTEEIEIASFQAGCQFEDALYGVLFGLAQYHLDIQLTPVAPSQAMNANPEKLIAAFARGCKVNRDMWRDFNPWEHFNKQVSDLRRDFNIVPKQ